MSRTSRRTSCVRAAASGARPVQIGATAGDAVQLPAAPLPANSVEVRGHAACHTPLEGRRDAYRQLTEPGANGDITFPSEDVRLTDVAITWGRSRAGPGTKLVLVPQPVSAAGS